MLQYIMTVLLKYHISDLDDCFIRVNDCCIRVRCFLMSNLTTGSFPFNFVPKHCVRFQFSTANKLYFSENFVYPRFGP